MANVQVLIVGAGPSGLFTAIVLKKLGISFRIIEKNTSYSDKSKALAIQSRSLEILAQLGIIEPFLQKGKALKGAQFFCKKRSLGKVSFENISSSYPFALALEQSETENIFRKELHAIGVSIETSVELISLKQDREKIEATLKKEKGEETITASWVIGCDGAHSFVRKSLLLSFQGKLFKDIFSLADVYIKGDIAESHLSIFLEAKGVMAIFPLPEKQKFRLIFQMDKYRRFLKKSSSLEHGIISSEAIPPPSLEEAQSMLQSYLPQKVELYSPIWMAHFHINSRLSSCYQKNRLFLVGDAAHIHSPIGGQGMNTGFQDAFNLAWKLFYVEKKTSSPSLLKTYQEERYSVGKTLLKATERASFMATLHFPLWIFFRNLFLSFLLKKKFFQKKITAALSQTNIRYPQNEFFFEKGFFPSLIRLGKRAPNISLYQEDKKVDLAFWQKDISCSLLLFFLGDNKEKTLQPFLKEALEKFPLKAFWISREKAPSIYHDPLGKAHDLYTKGKPAIYFIRPDGFIGFRSDSIDLFSLKGYLARVFSA